jgi:hypothetical protein
MRMPTRLAAVVPIAKADVVCKRPRLAAIVNRKPGAVSPTTTPVISASTWRMGKLCPPLWPIEGDKLLH